MDRVLSCKDFSARGFLLTVYGFETIDIPSIIRTESISARGFLLTVYGFETSFPGIMAAMEKTSPAVFSLPFTVLKQQKLLEYHLLNLNPAVFSLPFTVLKL